jgi:hypothetical protein
MMSYMTGLIRVRHGQVEKTEKRLNNDSGTAGLHDKHLGYAASKRTHTTSIWTSSGHRASRNQRPP